MKSYFLSTLVTLISIASFAEQVDFQYPNGNPIQLTSEDTKLITDSASKPSEKGFRTSSDALNNLPAYLEAKLLNLNARDLNLVSLNRDNSDEYAQFLKYMGLNPEQAIALRHSFIDHAAKALIEDLHKNPTTTLRVLARDLNEVYSQVELLLSHNNSVLGLTNKEKMQILNRIALVPASRPMIDSVLKGPNATEQMMALFQLKESTFQQGHVILLDSGYEGSIAVKLYDMFKTKIESNKLSWNFIWKAAHAPAFIKQYRLADFEKTLAQQNLLEKFYVADKTYSFRVALLEHFPKWTGRTLSWKADPTVIMLDLDDTVLKEVDLATNRTNSHVQLIKYIPGIETAHKYRTRLANPVRDESKVVHFEFNGEMMMSSVTVRPAIENFITDLEPLIKAGKIRLLVTSNNDPTRTEAMMKQLKLNGHTLQSIGAEYVPSVAFNDAKFQKDMGMLRKNLKISEGSAVIAIDDLPKNYVRSNVKDEIEGVKAFQGDYVKSTLRGEATEQDVQDKIQFGRLREAIFESIIVTEAQSAISKIRAAYISKGQEKYTLSLTPQVKIGSCHTLFNVGGK